MANLCVICCFVWAVLIAGSSRASDVHKFTVGLYSTIAKSSQPGKNIAISPFSVSSALTLTYIGAAGQTKTEIANALGVGQNVTEESLGQKYQLVNAASDKYTLKSANAVYLDKSHPILPEYNRTVVEDFKAQVSSVDFRANAEGIRQEINTFVGEKTNQKIKDLLPAGSLSANTVFVLVNAVYFKADWQTRFQVKNTKRGEKFTLTTGKQKTISLMATMKSFRYTESSALGQAQVLEMPYKGGETSMVLILPRNSAGLEGVERALTAETLETALGSLRSRLVQVYLPKFKVTTNYELTPTLRGLGVKRAFQRDADFSAMTNSTGVRISMVQHKVFVEVDERGTEAAAATAMSGRGKARAAPRPPRPVVFRADHPFLFLIRHNPSNTVLFMGRIADPTVSA